VAGRFRGVLQSLQRIVNRKAAGLLARWELPKGGEELRDVLLRRHHDESVVHPPPSVIDAFVVGAFERIGAQVEELRESQRHERVLPHIQALRTLFGKDNLPLVITQTDERTVIVEVEKFVTRAG